MNGFEDISGKGKQQLTPDKLQAYLEGRLAPEEQHDVERWLSEEGLESDAVEGLRLLDPEETRRSVNRINNQLNRQLASTKRARPKQVLDTKWMLVAVILILFVAIAAYWVLRIALR